MNQDVEGISTGYDDFRYVEFIRNPQKDRGNIFVPEVKCIALDYFDLIYSKKVGSFQKCMVMENDIPCEAYQSIGLFRQTLPAEGNQKKKADPFIKGEEDPFELSQAVPFLAVLQIFFTPEYYLNQEIDDVLEGEMDALKAIIERAYGTYAKKTGRGFEAGIAVYHTVSTVDFCVVLKTNRMEFPVFLSNEIKAENIGWTYKRYAVYTVMGIFKDFQCLDNMDSYIGEGTALVTRVHLKRSLKREWEKLIESIAKEEYEEVRGEEDEQKRKQRKKTSVTDTHSIQGRYDLSVRIDGNKNILSILPKLLQFIQTSFSGGEQNVGLSDEEESKIDNSMQEGNWNSLEQIIKLGYPEYINVRIFFDCEDSFNKSDNQGELLENKGAWINRGKQLVEAEKQFKELQETIKGLPFESYLAEYLGKLHQIVHICKALYSRYDTNISIRMLSEYLTEFIALLQMNIDFLKDRKVILKDIVINFVWGINYLQQFIKVVTSVNTSSFQAPKYETEKDECSIVKLPIAYTQFLNEIFENYYDK